MATKNSGGGPAPDIIDSVIKDVFTGSRKSPLTKRGKTPATPAASSAPAAPDGKLVDRIVTYLSGLSSTERHRLTSAFAAAAARVSDDDTGEQDAAPEEAETNAAA